MTEKRAPDRPGRLVFMGSPDFALPSLQGLLKAGFEVPLVLSQPPRPAGRGRKDRPTAVAGYAAETGLTLRTPDSLEDPELIAALEDAKADWFVVVAYRLLPPELLALPPGGAINLHASLLPDYRGAAPIQRALLKGERRSGLSTFLLRAGVDDGPLLLQQELEIGPDENAGSLHDRMMHAGAELLTRTLLELAAGSLEPRPQVLRKGLHRAPKLSSRTRRLRFRRSAVQLHNRIRALAPFPGARCGFRDKSLQILDSRVLPEAAPPGSSPGEILGWDTRGLRVACGEGQLLILQVKPEGRRALSISDWINGHTPRTGECFSEERPVR